MSTITKVTMITFVLGVLTLASGHWIWPPNPMNGSPSSALMPHFLLVAFMESLAFGLGVSYLVLGWHRLCAVGSVTRSKLRWTHLAIVWSLMSWWPHDNLHQHIGTNFEKLIYLEYGFHVTLILSALLIAHTFWKILSEKA